MCFLKHRASLYFVIKFNRNLSTVKVVITFTQGLLIITVYINNQIINSISITSN
jgi:hypothetical protein